MEEKTIDDKMFIASCFTLCGLLTDPEWVRLEYSEVVRDAVNLAE